MARDARAVEMLAQGREVGDVARELGCALITAKRIHSKYRREIEAAAKARFDGVIEGAVRAKAMLANETIDASTRVIKRARDLHKRRATITERESKIAAVALKHDLEILNRGGVPARADVGIAPAGDDAKSFVQSVTEIARKLIAKDGT